MTRRFFLFAVVIASFFPLLSLVAAHLAVPAWIVAVLAANAAHAMHHLHTARCLSLAAVLAVPALFFPVLVLLTPLVLGAAMLQRTRTATA